MTPQFGLAIKISPRPVDSGLLLNNNGEVKSFVLRGLGYATNKSAFYDKILDTGRVCVKVTWTIPNYYNVLHTTMLQCYTTSQFSKQPPVPFGNQTRILNNEENMKT